MPIDKKSKPAHDDIQKLPNHPGSNNMHPATEQLINKFKHYAKSLQPFWWDTDRRGSLNAWNLLVSEGFVQLADIDSAITAWKAIERRGLPVDPKEYPGYEYAPPRRQRKDKSWNPYLQSKQFKYYDALAYFLKNSLQSLQIFSLRSIEPSLNAWGSGEFKIYIIVGKTPDSDWICLAPTVPDQVWERYHKSFHPAFASLTSCDSPNFVTQDLHNKISKILAKFKPIKVTGYYNEYTHEHQIFCTVASEKATAIEKALKVGKFWEDDIYYFNKNYHNFSEPKPANQLVNEYLQNQKEYMFCFWDVGCGYKFGCTARGDWIGLKYRSFMDYNP
jgi:hypothetical protein